MADDGLHQAKSDLHRDIRREAVQSETTVQDKRCAVSAFFANIERPAQCLPQPKPVVP